MENIYKEVRFDWYCQSCKHKDLGEDKEPCAECLTETVNLYSHKPVRYNGNVKVYIPPVKPDEPKNYLDVEALLKSENWAKRNGAFFVTFELDELPPGQYEFSVDESTYSGRIWITNKSGTTSDFYLNRDQLSTTFTVVSGESWYIMVPSMSMTDSDAAIKFTVDYVNPKIIKIK